MLKKRGQFTVFVIIGIVLLVVFAFMLYARALILNSQVKVQAKNLVISQLQTRAIDQHITQCLERISLEALEIAGRQGGKIYQDQGGSFIYGEAGVHYLPFTFENKDYNVSYAIVENDLCPNVSLVPPSYPYSNVYLEDLDVLYDDLCLTRGGGLHGFFGENVLTYACDPNGANRRNISSRSTHRCVSYPRYSNESIQYNIEQYINTNLMNCVNLSVFEELGHNITLHEEGVSSRLIYGIETFTVISSFPFTVQIRGGEPVQTIVDFDYRSSVRFKKFYNYLQDLIKKDERDVFFDIEEEYNISSGWDSFINLTKIPNPHQDCEDCDYEFDDIFIVQDNKSLIDDKPLTFIFASKNRRPALDWLHETYPSLGWVDIMAQENETIYLFPRGYDPDENLVEYDYLGWKETWDDAFVPAYCCNATACDITNCTVTNLYPSPHNWTLSSLFRETYRDANYTPNHSDAGYHKVIINVSSEGGLYDYQFVKILVFDLPVAVLTGENIYDDIPNDYASVEDPYILNGTESRSSKIAELMDYMLGDVIISDEFWWDDYYNNIEQFFVITSDPLLYVPLQFYNITNLKPFNFTGVGLHTASLQVNESVSYLNLTLLSEPAYWDINVEECLPHRDSSYSYPYNNTNGFQANHTCCLDDFTRANESYVCFARDQWGTDDMFDDNPDDGGLDFPNEPIDPDYESSPNSPNDIMKREFRRNCDEERGNICGGYGYETRSVAYDCYSLAVQGGGDRFCQGPASDEPVSDDPGQCTSYEGSVYDPSNHTVVPGLCNASWTCSDGADYDSGGGMACQAECSGGACGTAVNCVCADDLDEGENHGLTCDAQCDDEDDFGFVGDYCGFGCTSSCTFASSEFCPEFCIVRLGGCDANHRPDTPQTCKWDNDCTGDGCEYNEEDNNLRRDYCDECTANGIVQGNYCPTPGDSQGNDCYWRSPSHPHSCTGTICNLNVDSSPPSCNYPQQLECVYNSGWECVNPP
jgi:hypothetical protein